MRKSNRLYERFVLQKLDRGLPKYYVKPKSLAKTLELNTWTWDLAEATSFAQKSDVDALIRQLKIQPRGLKAVTVEEAKKHEESPEYFTRWSKRQQVLMQENAKRATSNARRVHLIARRERGVTKYLRRFSTYTMKCRLWTSDPHAAMKFRGKASAMRLIGYSVPRGCTAVVAQHAYRSVANTTQTTKRK